MDEEARKAVESVNARLSGMPYRIELVAPGDLRLLDKNARYMSHEMFRTLVKNIQRDGGLTSLPLCYREEDGTLTVLSGNHRVQAAQHAGVAEILVLVIDKPLSREERVAIQLSHNAIEGKDDPVILKELWDEIHDIDLKLYSGLDTELVKDLEKMQFVTIADSAPDFKQVILLFLPEEVDQIKALLEDADVLFSGDEHFIMSRCHYEDVFRLVIDAKEKFTIVNNPTALMKLFDLARIQLDQVPRPTSKGTVPELPAKR